jgi:hypothetical protein
VISDIGIFYRTNIVSTRQIPCLAQLVKKSSSFYTTRRSVIMFTKARVGAFTEPDESSSHPVSLRYPYNLTLIYHLYLNFLSGLVS